MARMMPFDEIPDNLIVPEGLYEVEVEEVEEIETKKGAKLMYHIVLRVTDHKKHAEYAGMMLHEYIVIGTDDDPDAEEVTTWKKRGGIRLKKFFQSVGINDGGALTKLIAAATGKKLIASVLVQADDEGTDRNRCGKLYPLGAADVGKAAGEAKPTKPTKPVKKAAPKPPADEDDDEDAPPPPKPTKAAKKPAPTPKDEDADGDEDGDDDYE